MNCVRKPLCGWVYTPKMFFISLSRLALFGIARIREKEDVIRREYMSPLGGLRALLTTRFGALFQCWILLFFTIWTERKTMPRSANAVCGRVLCTQMERVNSCGVHRYPQRGERMGMRSGALLRLCTSRGCA